jgi:hypothetical protein
MRENIQKEKQCRNANLEKATRMRSACVVTLLEQCLERFEHSCLLAFWERAAHFFSCAGEILICTFRLQDYEHTPEVAENCVENLF